MNSMLANPLVRVAGSIEDNSRPFKFIYMRNVPLLLACVGAVHTLSVNVGIGM